MEVRFFERIDDCLADCALKLNEKNLFYNIEEDETINTINEIRTEIKRKVFSLLFSNPKNNNV